MTAPIPIATRRRLNMADMIAVLSRQVWCKACGERMVRRDQWDFEHTRPIQMGGADDPSNVVIMCRPCHAIKSAEDARAIAKAKRIDAWRETGRHHRRKARPIKSRGFRKNVKRKLPSRPFQTRRADERAKT